MRKYPQAFPILLINLLAYVSPLLSAGWSYRIWTRTFRHNRPRREQDCYLAAEKWEILIQQRKTVIYRWGEESDHKVLLLHGWNGRATQFFQLVQAFTQAGYQVISADQPGFGESEGKHSGLLPVSQLIRQLAQSEGPFAAIVAHSFGWLAAINSEPEKMTHCLVGIAPPADFSFLLNGFARFYALNSRALKALKDKVCKTYSIQSLDEISVRKLGPMSGLPGLVVYDINDDKIPESQIEQIRQYWPGVELYETRGFGHTRMLYDESVAQNILNYVNSHTNAHH